MVGGKEEFVVSMPWGTEVLGGALDAFWAMQVMLCPLWAGAFDEWDTRSHQQDNLGCRFLRGFGILWSGILEDGARVAGGLSSGFAN